MGCPFSSNSGCPFVPGRCHIMVLFTRSNPGGRGRGGSNIKLSMGSPEELPPDSAYAPPGTRSPHPRGSGLALGKLSGNSISIFLLMIMFIGKTKQLAVVAIHAIAGSGLLTKCVRSDQPSRGFVHMPGGRPRLVLVRVSRNERTDQLPAHH